MKSSTLITAYNQLSCGVKAVINTSTHLAGNHMGHLDEGAARALPADEVWVRYSAPSRSYLLLNHKTQYYCEQKTAPVGPLALCSSRPGNRATICFSLERRTLVFISTTPTLYEPFFRHLEVYLLLSLDSLCFCTQSYLAFRPHPFFVGDLRLLTIATMFSPGKKTHRGRFIAAYRDEKRRFEPIKRSLLPKPEIGSQRVPIASTEKQIVSPVSCWPQPVVQFNVMFETKKPTDTKS